MDTPQHQWCSDARSLLGLAAQASVDAVAGSAADETQARERVPFDKAVKTWVKARDRANNQISSLQGALRGTGDPRCLKIAEFGLNGMSKGESTALQRALLECRGTGKDNPKLRSQTLKAVTAYRQFLTSNPMVALCDDNPFGIKCDLRGELTPALDAIQSSLS